MDEILTVAQGRFVLHRLPHRPNELLRAWDAADEYLLEHVQQLSLDSKQRGLIVNDTFGALAIALQHLHPLAMSDSYLSQQATRLNFAANNLPVDNVTLINSLSPLEGKFDWVLIKVPKTLALLEDQLIRLRPHLTSGSVVVVAGMLKALPKSVWTLLARLLGSTSSSLAKKKARLIFAHVDADLPIPANPYPIRYRLEGSEFIIANHANVFSRESLDIGTRFFLGHLPLRPKARDIIDLGCGNGVVGLSAAQLNPAAALHFVDESFMAIASAQENFDRAFGNNRPATFSVGDGLLDFAPQSADLILCNPPFHQQHTVGDHLAVGMFKQSARALRDGGELWVIGNRHLAYHQYLHKLFGNCTRVASNAKFVILSARRKT